MLLDVKNLNTYYGDSHVLQDMSLTIAEGEIVALLGRNGMGKTTTMKSIIGLVKPKSGRVIYQGKDFTGREPYQVAKAGIGYVPEERRIFPNLSVLDNLKMGIKAGRAGKVQSKNRWDLDRIYEHFPILKERSAQKGATLSGGEQQMLAICRTLMGNPELLLVDEPTEGLSPILVKEVRDMLDDINKAGVPILLVEHNLKVAMSLASRVYLMGKAHLGFSGTVEELDANPEIRAKYLEV
ncbi:MAG: ABC transporter ATP-binding protein [Deltaproteobacteria bacterium]|nr:ABC transporter ATP-binding protein [Deltaproteobacteria bacterium]MBW1812915.1 ABC transporter ATP-binding protein [Deltaproteobacteria bacterium]MBW1847459.1 ABC transporter ATP-binding protein [Deltaproteobacteria bacterium]MBW1983741.1 ABC transporter ATP-binding protein [Deltaproteobacteria bacterium]MBW2365869.1 ABC transporter ATP-binding protein [Deltaproteobacteria bacterium]